MGLSPADVLDFSASINPLGPPAAVFEALAKLDLTSYPDSDCISFRTAVSRRLEVPAERILAGNGSTELIHLLARAYLTPDDTAVIFAPTFGEYEAACRAAHVNVVTIQAEETKGFMWDLNRAVHLLQAINPKAIFLCNPNNPTGTYLSRQDVERIAEAAPKAILAVDEAYATFADEPWDSMLLLKYVNVVLLHSMTKNYAMPALRLGYAIADRSVIHHMAALQPSWSVNGAALAAGIAAFTQDPYLQISRECVLESKAFLVKALRDAGVYIVAGASNFILVNVGDGPAVRRTLLQHGLCVRDCTSFGLPSYIRISMRTLPETKRLAQALLKAVHRG